MYYLHVQDFVDAYIGPFQTSREANMHFLWTIARGDGAALMGISTDAPPADAFVVTPEVDRDGMIEM